MTDRDFWVFVNFALALFVIAQTSSVVKFCGKTPESVGKTPKIINGIPSAPHEFPWHVGVRSLSVGSVYCGGVLISQEWVLSAAHCFTGLSSNDIEILLGKQDLTKSEPGERTLGVNEIICHRKFNPLTMHNDLALLKLNRTVTFSETIAPICLPCNRFQTHEGDQVWVVGWGSLEPNSKVMSTVLQKTNLTVLNDGECRDYFGQIPNGAMCALGEHGQDACIGDSGGPMMHYNKKRCQFEVIGVVSWGIGCGQQGVPGIYSRVTSAFNFFHNTLWKWDNRTKCN